MKFGHGIYDGNDICIGAEEMKPKGIWQGGKLFNSKKQWIFQWIQIGVLLLLAIAVVALTIVNVMGMRESIHASTERYVEDVARQLALDIETLLLKDSQELELTVEEQFIRKICASDADKAQAAQFLAQSRGLFAGNTLNSEDKESLIKCLMEIYEDSRDNSGE